MRISALCIAFTACLALYASAAEPAGKLSPTVITADKMVTEEGKGMVLFIGNVEATNNDITLKADQVEVYSDEKKESVVRIVAIGNVAVTKGDRKVTGGHAELNYVERQVTVTDSPSINDKDNRISGEKIIYSYDKEGIIVDGGGGKRATLLLSSPKK